MKFLMRRCGASPWLAAALCAGTAAAGDFSVTPIRVELKAGAAHETLTVTNHRKERLRLAVRLVEWRQDAEGRDVYSESSDLAYLPRELELAGESQRLVRVGTDAPAAAVERTYRLFIEEQPAAAGDAESGQVALSLRFGVPIFLPPAAPKPQPEALPPTLKGGKLSLVVRNAGNQHFRLLKLAIADGAGYRQELPGWYSLAGSERTYSADIPSDICRSAITLRVALEGEDFRLDRQLAVDPADCA
jgi:fimbrial chaperone protein